MPRQKTIWCDTFEEHIVHDTAQEEAEHERYCPTCRAKMADWRRGEYYLVQDHYGFIERPEAPVKHEIPVWHGPVRVKRPVRTSIWWEKKEATQSGPDDEFEEINLQEQPTISGEQFLHRLFGEPDPAACGIIQYFTMADLNSLKYTCKSFNRALTGDGVWAWMLTNVAFGNEHRGGTDAFNGIRRLTNRLPFWDNPSVQGIIIRWDMLSVLVNVNLDSTAVDASCIDWLLNNSNTVKRISVRYCRGIKLAEFLAVLEGYAEQGRPQAKRLEKIFIDYWNTPEIYSVLNLMLIEQALIDQVAYVASKLRWISRLIDSNVFLCYRNHYGEGIWGPDKIKFREAHGLDAVIPTFYPAEIILMQCAMCRKTYERRWCFRCMKANICTYCNQYRCLVCDPESYVKSIKEGHAFTLARLHESESCCSDVAIAWKLKHYFHANCAVDARRLEKCSLCDKFICWNIPGIHCPNHNCYRRQCPHSPGYCLRLCQFCKLDYAYNPEYRSLPTRAALIHSKR
ncbi:hypothetical protein TWF481_006326 [Arthrobotrys musiformis]|uniref:F-box domain-containing protein n=1 Tax=Arthrobotrys musiformis TaxID=47236 RepID=A0AAV9WGX3_9PEZI